MRVIRITTNYDSYLNQFYRQHSELAHQPYQIQYQTLMADCFGWADFWTQALSKLGYEVWEPVGNAESMQKAWALEHGVQYSQKNWLTDIIAAQTKHFQPDVLFLDDYISYTANFINYLRQENPSIKLVLGWCGAPYDDESVFQAYDIVLSNLCILVENFCGQGHDARYFRHAFSPHILQKIDTRKNKNINFSFIGSVNKGASGHLERELLLKELVRDTDLQIWANILSLTPRTIRTLPLRQILFDITHKLRKIPGANPFLSRIPKVRNYLKLTERPSLITLDPAITNRTQPPLFGVAMYQCLQASKITFNNHINLSSQTASNMRMFEATGVGTCLITDWKKNLHEFFELDREVVTYRSPEECSEKVKWLLDHPKECGQIAQAGQSRTLRDHNFDQRAVQLSQIIQSHLK